MALAASVTTLRHLILAVQCCGHTAIMPSRLAVSGGVSGTLADMVLRLTCQRCGGAPAVVTLDRMDGLTAPYGNAPWRLVLVLADDASRPTPRSMVVPLSLMRDHLRQSLRQHDAEVKTVKPDRLDHQRRRMRELDRDRV